MSAPDPIMQLWQIQIIAGNECYESSQFLSALAHYRQAIQLAQELFDKAPTKRTAVTSLIVSYHNLADLFIKEGEPDLAESELIEVHQIVNSTLAAISTAPGDIEALIWGAGKTYSALTSFLRSRSSCLTCHPPCFSNSDGKQTKVYFS